MIAFATAVTSVNSMLFTAVKWAVYAVAGLMIYEVIARYTLTAPTSWAPELATLIFGPYFLLGGPYLLHIGGHVAVDILSARATGKLKNILIIVGMLLAFLFGAILLWFSFPQAVQSFEYGETTFSAWNPVIWPNKAALPLAAFLLCLQALSEIILHLRGKGGN
ncbi:TRAP transporter small permease subunit [Sneathiella chinensis]|uniref:TRAP transporter small permease protein n=1 Tax=Sneathiella chinensis TaxID=349750 RepID=A0ABQ5U3P7_9PROT|nr:TRAP transporter small permease subunit [Sneathiella chinensis]GLQ06812.1 C4-dicarboxylate ABC transporter [Sneathiella chinensis]